MPMSPRLSLNIFLKYCLLLPDKVLGPCVMCMLQNIYTFNENFTRQFSLYNNNFVNLIMSRWEDLPLLKGVLLRISCSLGQQLRPEEVAVSCDLAEVYVSAWELLPGQLQGQQRAEDLTKVRDQRWFLASQFNPLAQQPVRRAKIIQVNK